MHLHEITAPSLLAPTRAVIRVIRFGKPLPELIEIRTRNELLIGPICINRH